MEKERLKIFSERLTKLRQKKELTQQQLGEVLQIPRVSITRYETAERTPTVDHLVQFAQFFNVPSDYLLGLSGAKSYDPDLQSICKYTGLSDDAIKALSKHFGSSKQKSNYFSISDLPEQCDIANDFILNGFFEFIIKLHDLVYLGYDWRRECEEYIYMEMECDYNECANATRISNEMDNLKFIINRIINNFIQNYDIRYKTLGYPSAFLVDKEAFEILRKKYIEWWGKKYGEHNPSEE